MILSNYAIKFRVAVFVLILVIIITGSLSYMNMPREGSPDITIPFVFVTAYYEGTAPAEMEKLVTLPLEKTLSDLENVKEIKSTSAESICSISIEFMAGQDIDQARQRVKNKVDLARPDLPEDLDEPVADAFNFSSDFPVYMFALSGDTELERLKSIAERLQDEIELIPGVKQAEISGVREREIRVELDLTRLIAYDIPISLVMQRISQENSTVSAGNIEIKGDKFQVRIPGEFSLVSDMKEILLVERNGKPVYLTDIATVADTYKDLQSISRLNGRPSVSISVKKRSRENAVLLIESIRELLHGFVTPPGVEFDVVMDESEYVEMMIADLENNIATGFILVLIVLFVFMGGRNSLFVAVAIPLSMLAAFTVLALIGYTLNMMVLFSLVLAVGMLVDNAIVIVENIFRHHTMGKSKIDSARIGTSEVAWPVITSTITTCAAFSPLLFWPDIMGQFMGIMPRTLIIVLMASLFVAMVINPAICSALISKGKKKPKIREAAALHPFQRWYERFLRAALRYRFPLFLLGVLFMVFSIMAYGEFGRGQELFAEVDPRNATVNIKFPQGTSIEKTDAVLRDIENTLLEGKGSRYPDIEFILGTVGSIGGGNAIFSQGGGSHVGSIHIEFVDSHKRTGITAEQVALMRADIGSIPGVEVKVEKEKMGPPTDAPITIELSGDDFEVLSQYSARIIQSIETIEGLVDLRDDYEAAVPELQFRVDRQRAALMGLDTDTIGLFLRTSIYGLETSKFRADEDEYDITIRLPEDQRDNLALLDQIYIPIYGGVTVPLSSLGNVVYTGGRGSIKRTDQKRVVTIRGNNGNRGVDKILADIKPEVDAIELPHGYSIKYAGDDEEMKQASAFLGKAFGVALLLIIVVLVIQFNSVLQPGVIMISVLLSLIGVMWGLLVCKMRFSVVMTGVGIISLAGIVVNNAIVLVDCIRQQREKGANVTEAIVQAGLVRLRPVLLTAVTTILGLIPMAIGLSLEIHDWPPKIIAGAETSTWWAPMAVAVIFGLGVATILTLVLVPVMYSLSDSLSRTLLRLVSDDEGLPSTGE